MENLNEYNDNLIEFGIATQKEIILVTKINGWTSKTLNNILYARTGYRKWERFVEYEKIRLFKNMMLNQKNY